LEDIIMTIRQINHMAQDAAVVVGIMLYLTAVFACLMALLMAIASE
jgi:hypothetical protein